MRKLKLLFESKAYVLVLAILYVLVTSSAIEILERKIM